MRRWICSFVRGLLGSGEASRGRGFEEDGEIVDPGEVGNTGWGDVDMMSGVMDGCGRETRGLRGAPGGGEDILPEIREGAIGAGAAG